MLEQSLFLFKKHVFFIYSDVGLKLENSTDFEEEDNVQLLLPAKEDLQILLDR